MPSKVFGEIIHPIPNFNGCTVEVRKWISNFVLHFMIMQPIRKQDDIIYM